MGVYLQVAKRFRFPFFKFRRFHTLIHSSVSFQAAVNVSNTFSFPAGRFTDVLLSYLNVYCDCSLLYVYNVKVA